MGAEETKKVQDNESKADKFVRLGEYRVNKVIDAIGRLENLSNRTNYEYTQEQVEAMFSIMEKRLLEVKGRFAPKKEKEDTIAGLKNAAGYARRCLAQSLNLRNTPELRFILDESIEYGIEMSKKIDALTGGKEEE